MPLQNRLMPFGDIVAIPQRGMFTGNRGIIHHPIPRMLLNGRWTSEAWLVCLCEFKGELSPNVGDGLRIQAAAVLGCEDAGLAATSIPSVNLTP
jgi:hypothetical protein